MSSLHRKGKAPLYFLGLSCVLLLVRLYLFSLSFSHTVSLLNPRFFSVVSVRIFRTAILEIREDGRSVFFLFAFWREVSLRSASSAEPPRVWPASSPHEYKDGGHFWSQLGGTARWHTPKRGALPSLPPLHTPHSKRSCFIVQLCSIKGVHLLFRQAFYISDFSKINSSRRTAACLMAVTFFAII